jgi:ATP-dependent helicase/nuclease subunit B
LSLGLPGPRDFCVFFTMGPEILHFIEQLDLEDVPCESLMHLKENAQIGFNVPEDINKLLIHLGELRQAYHRQLEVRELAISLAGYQYLQASRRVNTCDVSAFDEILFCNFFYLHRTENTVIKNIYDRASTVLFMQGDQRRWPALGRMAKLLDTPIFEGPEVAPTKFDLKIYEAFDAHAQAGLGQ